MSGTEMRGDSLSLMCRELSGLEHVRKSDEGQFS